MNQNLLNIEQFKTLIIYKHLMKKIYKKKKLLRYFEREIFLFYYAILLHNYKIFLYYY